MANDGIKIKAPVSMTDIATVLGDSTNMGVSENIKIWSRNKPYEAHDNHYKTQTGNDRLRNAYGFYWWNVSQEADAPFATSASALMDKALASKGEWKWKKPVTTQRMGDFDGYNHLAHQPYDVSSYVLGGANRVIGLIRPWDADPELGYDKEVEIHASDMPAVDGANVIAGFECLMLMRPVEGGEIIIVPTYSPDNMTVGDLDSMMDANFTYETPPTDGQKTYDVVFAASDINRNYWMYFPTGVGRVTTGAALSAYLMRFRPLDIGGSKIEYNDRNTTLDVLELNLRISNNMARPITVQYTIHIWIDGEYDSTDNPVSGSISVAGGTYASIEKADLYPNDDATIDNIKMTMDLNYYDNGVWNYCRYDFLAKKIMDGNTSEDDGVTIAEIAESENA